MSELINRRALMQCLSQLAGGVLMLGAMPAGGAPPEPNPAERVQELEARLARYEQEIEDLRADALHALALLEEEPAKRKQLEAELAQARERAVRKKAERTRYLAERDQARRLAVKLARGEMEELPEWGSHPFYGGGNAVGA